LVVLTSLNCLDWWLTDCSILFKKTKIIKCKNVFWFKTFNYLQVINAYSRYDSVSMKYSFNSKFSKLLEINFIKYSEI
jgi:hypothetical protein